MRRLVLAESDVSAAVSFGCTLEAAAASTGLLALWRASPHRVLPVIAVRREPRDDVSLIGPETVRRPSDPTAIPM